MSTWVIFVILQFPSDLTTLALSSMSFNPQPPPGFCAPLSTLQNRYSAIHPSEINKYLSEISKRTYVIIYWLDHYNLIKNSKTTIHSYAHFTALHL